MTLATLKDDLLASLAIWKGEPANEEMLTPVNSAYRRGNAEAIQRSLDKIDPQPDPVDA